MFGIARTLRAFNEALNGFPGDVRRETFEETSMAYQDALWARESIAAKDRHYASGHVAFRSLRPKVRRTSNGRPSRFTFDRYRNDDPLKQLDFEEYAPLLAPDSQPANGKCHCPAPGHEDRHPSCSYRGGLFYCFSCHAAGDIYTLAGLISGIDTRQNFPALRRWLADRLGVVA